MSVHDQDPIAVPDKTSFRRWMDFLNSPRGDAPEWPLLLREMLQEEFRRQRGIRHCYVGEVFKDRDADDPNLATLPEKRSVRLLYQLCLGQTAGCLRIGDTPYCLLGYEWPNQGRETGRRADLVGLTAKGGLAVFECKVAGNFYGPIASALEGLDYLSCLTSEPNFNKICEGFARGRDKTGKMLPPGFEAARPELAERHEVVVLASSAYFDRFGRSGRGLGWTDFARLSPSQDCDSVLIRFAETDYATPSATWITG